MSKETPESIAKTNGHLLGIATGWKEAADWLIEQAAGSFKAGEDKEAQLLRGFAQFALRTSSEKRTAYEAYKNKVAADDPSPSREKAT